MDDVTQLLNLERALEAYKPSGQFEKAHVLHTRALILNQVMACLDRKSFNPGHLTGTAVVLNPARDKVLMIFHPTLNIWLMPGGHADHNPALAQVAMRELEEETGLLDTEVQPFFTQGHQVFDVDTHYIPVNLKKNEPEHIHFDLTYLWVAQTERALVSPEGLPIQWMTFDDVAAQSVPNGRRSRIVDKLRTLTS